MRRHPLSPERIEEMNLRQRNREARAFAAGFDDGEWPAIVEPEPFQPSNLCGSQRDHEPHEWTGQTTGKKLNCPGYPDNSWRRTGVRAV